MVEGTNAVSFNLDVHALRFLNGGELRPGLGGDIQAAYHLAESPVSFGGQLGLDVARIRQPIGYYNPDRLGYDESQFRALALVSLDSLEHGYLSLGGGVGSFSNRIETLTDQGSSEIHKGSGIGAVVAAKSGLRFFLDRKYGAVQSTVDLSVQTSAFVAEQNGVDSITTTINIGVGGIAFLK